MRVVVVHSHIVVINPSNFNRLSELASYMLPVCVIVVSIWEFYLSYLVLRTKWCTCYLHIWCLVNSKVFLRLIHRVHWKQIIWGIQWSLPSEPKFNSSSCQVWIQLLHLIFDVWLRSASSYCNVFVITGSTIKQT